VADPIRVTLTEPDVAGAYLVSERRDDGSLVLQPADDPADELRAQLRGLARTHHATLERLAG
jgi:hypothetical protein